VREQALLFGKTGSLVGIVTDPPARETVSCLPAVLLLNSGPIHRVGPNRLYVKMARKLATLGFVVFRFDFSGIGDSRARRDTIPFVPSAVAETQEAMDCLGVARGAKEFILAGICSGALISLKTACCDPRVVGVVPINAAGHRYGDGSADLYRTLANHYLRLAFSSSFGLKVWRKALAGKVDYRGLLRAMGSQLIDVFAGRKRASPGADTVTELLRLLSQRGVWVVLVHAEADEGLDYLRVSLGEEIQSLIAAGKLRLEVIAQSNHTFTLLSNQEHLLQVVCDWIPALAKAS